jgi:hypothetical protein
VGVTAESWLPADTLEFVRGRWLVERDLIDFRTGQRGWFRGVARCAELAAGQRTPGALGYVEEGELRFGSYRGPASRSLLLLPGPGGSAGVRFADGRPFYRLDLRSGTCTAEHPCGQDSYLVTVRVLGPDVYREHWRVTGPGKDYAMTTTLTRMELDA